MNAALDLRVSEHGCHLVRGDGSPFFWLADTAWELFHRLTREEADHYLAVRASQGFNVVQAVLLAEFEGLTEPNAQGHLPLHDMDPTRPNEAYFELVDHVVAEAQRRGMVVAMLPTWGDKFNVMWRGGPVIFTPQNAYLYGRWLGRRYAEAPIVWVLGGDRPLHTATHLRIVREMARGLHEGESDAGGTHHLRTFHPCGATTSAQFVHSEPWLDFNMLQSGHRGRDNANWHMIGLDRERLPTRPVLDGEPNYEDHPVMGHDWTTGEAWFDDYDTRKAAYRAVLAGACGHTYGCHDIWQMWTPQRVAHNRVRTPWTKALHLPGANQMRHLRTLAESHPILWGPAHPLRVAIDGVASDEPAEHGVVSEPGRAAVAAYLPTGRSARVTLEQAPGDAALSWLDPRTGKSLAIGAHRAGWRGVVTPPTSGPGCDWVLLVTASPA